MDVADTINAYFDMVVQRIAAAPGAAAEIAEAARPTILNIVLIGIAEAAAEFERRRAVQAAWLADLEHAFDEDVAIA